MTFYLHSDWEVILCLRREEHVHGLLLERLVARRRVAHLDDVQLATVGRALGEAEQGGVGAVALEAKLDERSRVALDRLAHLNETIWLLKDDL